MTMDGSKFSDSLHPHPAALGGGPTPDPRGLTDNDDPPGLPLAIRMLDVGQPYDEQEAGEAPALVTNAVFDGRWTDNGLPPNTEPLKVVYAGGPKALNATMEDEWGTWWETTHGLTVSTAGWCVYRHFDSAEPYPRSVAPQWVVMELPCLTMDGYRRRVRVATTPWVWRMSSELTIEKRSRALVPLNMTIAAEAEAGAAGFAERWRAYRRRRGK